MSRSSLIYINDGPMGKVFDQPGINQYVFNGDIDVVGSATENVSYSVPELINQPDLMIIEPTFTAFSPVNAGMYSFNAIIKMQAINFPMTEGLAFDFWIQKGLQIIAQDSSREEGPALEGTIYRYRTLSICLYLTPNDNINFHFKNNFLLNSTFDIRLVQDGSLLIINRIY